MDWNLGQVSAKYPLLRNTLIFEFDHIKSLASALFDRNSKQAIVSSPLPQFTLASSNGSPSLYYMIMLLNFILRFAWAIRLLLLRSQLIHNTSFQMFLMQVLEVFRRFIWIFLRVEKQWLDITTSHE
jgi:hypothetical protein